VLEVLYHSAKFGGAQIPPAAGVAKNIEFFVCLFVCSSRFWTSEIVRQISPWRHWSTETILMLLDRGRFVVVHPCSTLSDCCQLVTTLNAEPKNGKNWGFLPTEGDRINLSRRNLACKRTAWVCYSTPHLALIGKRGSVQEPPKNQNLPKIVAFGHQKPTQWTYSHEIWHDSPPNIKNCPKLWLLATRSRHNEHIQMKFDL